MEPRDVDYIFAASELNQVAGLLDLDVVKQVAQVLNVVTFKHLYDVIYHVFVLWLENKVKLKKAFKLAFVTKINQTNPLFESIFDKLDCYVIDNHHDAVVDVKYHAKRDVEIMTHYLERKEFSWLLVHLTATHAICKDLIPEVAKGGFECVDVYPEKVIRYNLPVLVKHTHTFNFIEPPKHGENINH